MKENWSNKQTEFWNSGYTIFDGLFPDELLLSWKHLVEVDSELQGVEGVNHINKEFKTASLENRDSIGSYKFTSIDGRRCFSFKGLSEYYYSMTNFLSIFTGLDIVSSFDQQSSITMLNYKPPGGNLLAHFDTQTISFLLYLTDNPDEGATKLYPLSALRPTNLNYPDEIIGEPILVYPKFNRCLIFQGRRIWHESLPVYKNNKISSVWNYYAKDDKWRPADVSKRLYS